jgi:hypothetical protein
LDEDESDDCSCNDEAFDAFGFHGLDSVDVSETSGGGGENEVENPKSGVFVAFDALVISKDSDSIGERVVVNVNETGTEEGDCCVNLGKRNGDVNGEAGCDGVCDGGEDSMGFGLHDVVTIDWGGVGRQQSFPNFFLKPG